MTGDEVKIFRKSLGLSQRQFAKALGGLETTTVHRWEAGQSPVSPVAATLIGLIDAMHWSVAQPMKDWLKARGKP